MDILQAIAITGSTLIFAGVVEFIRRGLLKEKYSLLWLLASFVLIVLSLSREILHFLSQLVGIYYPPSFLFLLAFIFMLLITLHFTIVLSELSDKVKRLSQELALLKMQEDKR